MEATTDPLGMHAKRSRETVSASGRRSSIGVSEDRASQRQRAAAERASSDLLDVAANAVWRDAEVNWLGLWSRRAAVAPALDDETVWIARWKDTGFWRSRHSASEVRLLGDALPDGGGMYSADVGGSPVPAALENAATSLRVEVCEDADAAVDDAACVVCGSTKCASGPHWTMLLCDGPGCSSGCHLQCHDPPLASVPNGEWFCADCQRQRDTAGPRARKRGSSRYVGVSRTKGNRWVANATVDGRAHYLGTFDEEESAARAYDDRVRGLGRPLNFATRAAMAKQPSNAAEECDEQASIGGSPRTIENDVGVAGVQASEASEASQASASAIQQQAGLAMPGEVVVQTSAGVSVDEVGARPVGAPVSPPSELSSAAAAGELNIAPAIALGTSDCEMLRVAGASIEQMICDLHAEFRRGEYSDPLADESHAIQVSSFGLLRSAWLRMTLRKQARVTKAFYLLDSVCVCAVSSQELSSTARLEKMKRRAKTTGSDPVVLVSNNCQAVTELAGTAVSPARSTRC